MFLGFLIFMNRKILLFLIFNCVLSGLDVGTDFATFVTLVTLHPWWAGLTLVWVFVPFFINLGKFTYDVIRNWKNGEGMDKMGGLKDVFIHFPFVLTIRNFCLADRLYGMGFGTSGFDPALSAKVEDIQREV